jgi:hypothetical protein
VGGKGPHSYNNFFSIYEVCTRQCLPKMPWSFLYNKTN